jgi:hypothetical protein
MLADERELVPAFHDIFIAPSGYPWNVQSNPMSRARKGILMNHPAGPPRNCSRVQFIPHSQVSPIGVLPHAEGWHGGSFSSPGRTPVTLAPMFPVETTCATVLFADKRGYTGLAERLPPARVVPLLDEFFGVLAGATEIYGGEVFHMAGDGMITGFGVRDPDAPPLLLYGGTLAPRVLDCDWNRCRTASRGGCVGIAWTTRKKNRETGGRYGQCGRPTL